MTQNLLLLQGPNKWSNDSMEIDPFKAKKAIVDYHVGSVLNTINNLAQTLKVWFENISNIQKFAMDSTEIKIPIIYGIDAIHGATYSDGATMFLNKLLQQLGIHNTHIIWDMFVHTKQSVWNSLELFTCTRFGN